MTTITTNTLTTLTNWMTEHYPDAADAADLIRWPHTLPSGHTTDQLRTALEEWRDEHPDTPPRPAHIAERIRKPGARQRIAELRTEARSRLPGRTIACAHEAIADRQRARITSLSKLVVTTTTTTTDGVGVDLVVDASTLAHQPAAFDLYHLGDGYWTATGITDPAPLTEILWRIACRYEPTTVTP